MKNNHTVRPLNLQLFADAGTLVNATGNYVNAGTGAATAFSGTNTLSAELKTYYDTELLENTKPQLIYYQFAKQQALPANHGKTVEWRKWNTFAKASQLTEGVIPTGQRFGVSTVSATINQYGTYASVSDALELHAYDNVILGATAEMASSAAETQESLIRAGLMTGTNVLYADTLKSDGTWYATPTACSGLKCGGSATVGEGDSAVTTANLWSRMTADTVAKAVTKLRKAKVPTIKGRYYCVVHPSVAYDLRNDPAWLEAHKYARPEEIFNGEIGELHGVRFVENPNAPVLTDSTYRGGDYASGTCNAATYASFFFGADSFGVVKPEGGALEMIVHDKSEIGGPLNQFSTIGYKLETNGATILYPERVLRVMSCSSFSASDTAN